MSITLGEFKTALRRNILKDEDPESPRWSNEEITDYFQWALEAFTAHTALPKRVTFPAVGREYELPEDIYEPLDTSGLVYVDDGCGNQSFYRPVKTTTEDGISLNADRGFWTRPITTLRLTSDPPQGDLVVEYYAYYPAPAGPDDDAYELPVPRWAIPALSYLVGAHALAGLAMRSSNIRQWSQSPDRGDPEDNPLRVQQEWMLKMYENELARHPKQNRSNHLWE